MVSKQAQKDSLQMKYPLTTMLGWQRLSSFWGLSLKCPAPASPSRTSSKPDSLGRWLRATSDSVQTTKVQRGIVLQRGARG